MLHIYIYIKYFIHIIYNNFNVIFSIKKQFQLKEKLAAFDRKIIK